MRRPHCCWSRDRGPTLPKHCRRRRPHGNAGLRRERPRAAGRAASEGLARAMAPRPASHGVLTALWLSGTGTTPTRVRRMSSPRLYQYRTRAPSGCPAALPTASCSCPTAATRRGIYRRGSARRWPSRPSARSSTSNSATVVRRAPLIYRVPCVLLGTEMERPCLTGMARGGEAKANGGGGGGESDRRQRLASLRSQQTRPAGPPQHPATIQEHRSLASTPDEGTAATGDSTPAKGPSGIKVMMRGSSPRHGARARVGSLESAQVGLRATRGTAPCVRCRAPCTQQCRERCGR